MSSAPIIPALLQKNSHFASIHFFLQIFRLALSDDSRVYELYTAATGVYVCLLLARASALVTGWVQQGWAQLSKKMKEWTFLVRIRVNISNSTQLFSFFI